MRAPRTLLLVVTAGAALSYAAPSAAPGRAIDLQERSETTLAAATVETEPERDVRDHAGPRVDTGTEAGRPEETAGADSSAETEYCAMVRERFGPRPDGAPCWHLTPREERELTREHRQETLQDPDNLLPWKSESWPFSEGESDRVPPYRTPQGYGYEQVPDWVAAGAYSVSQMLPSCPEGSRAELLGSVQAGAWAVHATGCLDSAGRQTAGAVIYAQPDPRRCGGPWLWESCGSGRLVLLSLAGGSDDMRPAISGAESWEDTRRVSDIRGGLDIVVTADNHGVPYLISSDSGGT